MPPRTRVNLPPGVQAAVDGLGISPVRVRLLMELATEGSGTIPSLTESLGFSAQLTSYHLRALEEAGLVTADRTDRLRGGSVVTWTANHEQIDNQLAALQTLLGGH